MESHENPPTPHNAPMLSHKTVVHKGPVKGGFFTHKGFSQGCIDSSPGCDPPIDYPAVGESAAGSGRCVCQAWGGHEWEGPRSACGWVKYAQLQAGMFADCHFHFNLLPSSPPDLEMELESLWGPRRGEMGLNADTPSTKATSGEGRARRGGV